MKRPNDKPFDDRTPAGAAGPNSRGSEDVSLLEQLAEFSRSAGEYGSAMEYYEQILDIADRARQSSNLVAMVFYRMGALRCDTMEFREGLKLLDKALENLSGEDEDQLIRCRIENQRAIALLGLGLYDEAEQATRIVTESVVDPAAAAELARAQSSYGVVMMRRGDWSSAGRSLEAALAGYRILDDREGMTQTLNNLGLVERLRGNPERAVKHLTSAVQMAEDQGEMNHVGAALLNLGIAEFNLGQWEDAHDHWERALRVMKSVGNQSVATKASLKLGDYYRYKREWDTAADFYAAAEQAARDKDEPREVVLALEFRGDLAFASENYDEARTLYQEALEGGVALAPQGDLVLEVLRRLADLESSLGHHAEARQWLGRGQKISEAMDELYEGGVMKRIEARDRGGRG